MLATAVVRRIGAPDDARCSVLGRGYRLQREMSGQSVLGARGGVVQIWLARGVMDLRHSFLWSGCDRADAVIGVSVLGSADCLRGRCSEHIKLMCWDGRRTAFILDAVGD